MILTPRALILTHADESGFRTEILKMEKILKLEQKLEIFKFAHGAKRPVWRMADPGRERHFDEKDPGRAKYWSFDLGPGGKRGRAAAHTFPVRVRTNSNSCSSTSRTQVSVARSARWSATSPPPT
jgi:hypothetical protein